MMQVSIMYERKLKALEDFWTAKFFELRNSYMVSSAAKKQENEKHEENNTTKVEEAIQKKYDKKLRYIGLNYKYLRLT